MAITSLRALRLLALLVAFLSSLLSSLTARSQSAAPLPPTHLNHNLFPPSPEAAALGRFGDVPVSLYTGVPSIGMPLLTLPGRGAAVSLSLQYHGGGVRVDQVAPWTGMNWTLNAGGAITRSARGIDDFAPKGYARHTAPLPLLLSQWCYNGATNGNGTDPLNYYEYLKGVYEGTQDTQPDVFSFNFQGYAGKIIFDQFGTPHTTPAQPLQIMSPLTSGDGSWTLTTPEGTAYKFSATEMTSSEGSGTGQYGASAWFLTRITTAQQEWVEFVYQDYATTIMYSTSKDTANIMPSMSVQKVLDLNRHLRPDCLVCPRDLDLSPRPATFIRGKYLRRIVSATHRIDLLSDDHRRDQPGMRRLHTIRLKYLADSVRYQEFRLRYGYYDGLRDRLFLQQVQKVGREGDGRETAEPPYTLTYDSPLGTGGVGGAASPARGTYDVDRWGYYNAAGNTYPFPRDNRQNYQVLAAQSRETNPAWVTFGLLRSIRYPTGGTSSFEFEANDFSNFLGPSYLDTPYETGACHFTEGGSDCGGLTQSTRFELTHAQTVQFEVSAEAADEQAIAENDATGVLHTVNAHGGTVQYAALPYRPLGGGATASVSMHSLALPAGRYELQATIPSERAGLQVRVAARYASRQYTNKKWQGGGTRIRRIVTYDGLDHGRDQIKEYHYDANNHTRSTGKLIHQPIFHTTTKFINITNPCLDGGTDPEDSETAQYTCYYTLHFADDMAAASGSAQGSAVGYDTVSVVQHSGGTSLRSTSIFYNQAAANIDLSDQATELQGFFPVNFDEKNGLLLETQDYAVAEGGDPFQAHDVRLVRRVVQRYGNDSIPDKEIVGISIGGSLGTLLQESPMACRGVTAQTYKTYVGWWPLTQTQETRYDQLGHAFTTTTRMLYRDTKHYQPYRQEVTSPDGRTQVTRFKYALDYAPTADAGVRLLQEQYRVTTPVEVQTWIRRRNQPAQWTGGKVTRFAATAGGVQPAQVLQAALMAPTRLSEATSAGGLFTTLLPVSDVYQTQAAFAYGPQGLLREQSRTHDRPTAYLWGYDNLRPIAEVRNATAEQVAYTSFEHGSAGAWQYAEGPGQGRETGLARTGTWAFRLQPGRSVMRLGLPAGRYLLTFWATAPPQLEANGVLQVTPAPSVEMGAWRQYVVRMSLPAGSMVRLLLAAGGGSCLVDELRLHPDGAQMVSATMDALGGTSAQTDASGRTTTYEYDALGRLLRARDEKGHVLIEQDYKYARP